MKMRRKKMQINKQKRRKKMMMTKMETKKKMMRITMILINITVNSLKINTLRNLKPNSSIPQLTDKKLFKNYKINYLQIRNQTAL